MENKKGLLNLFKEECKFYYHIIKFDDIKGHLIYITNSNLEISKKNLEFSPTTIIERIMKENSINIEKIAPSIFFTDNDDLVDLKSKLNKNLKENKKFSRFIDKIKNDYRYLEVKDFLIFKKDPEEYNRIKKEEYEKRQKNLWNKIINNLENDKNKN